MKILKFGGSSVSDSARIRHVGTLIKEGYEEGLSLSVVFSAFGGVTDMLIKTAEEASMGKNSYRSGFEDLKNRNSSCIKELVSGKDLIETLRAVEENMVVLKNLLKGVFLVREVSRRTMDYILSFGERNSTFIIARYFNSIGIPAKYADAREFIKTNKDFGQAKVDMKISNDLITQYYRQNSQTINLVTGFIASDIGGLTTTLGRGGSDYTAAILAGALNADLLEIWTDVDGVLTSDPRIVKTAYTIPELSYSEAMELSHFGAKVIYPPTIQPALGKSIPIAIKNTFNPTFKGTIISQNSPIGGKRKITGVTSISNLVLITLEGSGLVGIPGTAARLFDCLGKKQINIVMITQASSEHSICFALNTIGAQLAISAIEQEFRQEIASNLIDPVNVEDDLSLIAVIGEKMRSSPGVAGRLFMALGHNGINVVAIAQGSSELNISFAIKKIDEHKALNLVHDIFFLSENKRVNVYLVGVGLIGGTLIGQISEQHKILLKEKKLDIRIVCMANSRKMLFKREGLNVKDWKSILENQGKSMSIEEMLQQMKTFNLPNSVFVDCTANKDIVKYYPRILQKSISISAANKIANSSSYDQYKSLVELAIKKNVHFLYETNVGAGLPVLSTLSALVESGDKVESIHAVISGSLSFIFNNYSPNRKFKDLILEARKMGYTEPDPREDLSGKDIKRKIIILSRVAGYPIEPEDVKVEDLLPESCMAADNIDQFFLELDNHDLHFRSMIEKAHKNATKLRYVASLEEGVASIHLKFVGKESPFYNLSSTDNMVVIHTERYKERPLIIQGPGAGADVTAAGVFAEIIHLGMG